MAHVGDEGDEDGDEAAPGPVTSSCKSRDFRFSCSCRMKPELPELAGGVLVPEPSCGAAAGGVLGRPFPPT